VHLFVNRSTVGVLDQVMDLESGVVPVPVALVVDKGVEGRGRLLAQRLHLVVDGHLVGLVGERVADDDIVAGG